MPTKCNCQTASKPKSKKKPAPKKKIVQPVAISKSNKGCMVKNIIVINNGCCNDTKTKKTSTKRKTPKRSAPKRPPTSPAPVIIEEVKPVKAKPKKTRSYASPSPLVDYDSDERPRKTPRRAVEPKRTPRKSKTPTKRKESPRKAVPSKQRANKPRRESPSPLIEVVDYDDGYRGEYLERRERSSGRRSSDNVSQPNVQVVVVDGGDKKKSLKESYNDYKAKKEEKRSKKEESKSTFKAEVVDYEEPKKSQKLNTYYEVQYEQPEIEAPRTEKRKVESPKTAALPAPMSEDSKVITLSKDQYTVYNEEDKPKKKKRLNILRG